jgi:Na+/H+-dicarboxylate symporter
MNDQVKNKRGISLSTQILIGLTLGLFVGLFFGDKASALAIISKAYIGLIQMSYHTWWHRLCSASGL